MRINVLQLLSLLGSDSNAAKTRIIRIEKSLRENKKLEIFTDKKIFWEDDIFNFIKGATKEKLQKKIELLSIKGEANGSFVKKMLEHFSIKILSLYDYRMTATKASIIGEGLKKCEIKGLSFSSCSLGCDNIQPIITNLTKHKTLEVLYFIGEDLKHIAMDLYKFLKTSSITELGFDGCFIPNAILGLITKSLSYNDKIKGLDFKRCDVNNNGIKKISELLAINKNIVRLYIRGNSFDDNGLEFLAKTIKQNNIEITSLDLSNNKQIQNILSISKIFSLGTLKDLHFHSIDLSNQMGIFSKALEKLDNLRNLDVSDCKIDDAALIYITQLIKLGKLERINLEQNLITDKGLELIVNALDSEGGGKVKAIAIAHNENISFNEECKFLTIILKSFNLEEKWGFSYIETDQILQDVRKSHEVSLCQRKVMESLKLYEEMLLVVKEKDPSKKVLVTAEFPALFCDLYEDYKLNAIIMTLVGEYVAEEIL